MTTTPHAELLTDAEILNFGPGEEHAPWPYDAQLYFAREIERALLARLGEQQPMTAERIDRIAELTIKGMPDGIQGFLKTWGWQQFARALLDIVPAPAAQPVAQGERPSDDYRAWYEEAMAASNEAGYVGLDAAQTIKALVQELEAARSAAQGAAQVPAWQPIETAPRDGMNVLLVNRKGNMAAGLWQDGILGKGWFLRGGSEPDFFFNDHHGPTHWMPLPAAPSPAGERTSAEGWA